MVKALRSCLEAAKGKIKAGQLDPQKKPQQNSYRIFYSLKYIPYTHSTCRIYSLLVPGILESRMSQETASYWQSPSSREKLSKPRAGNSWVDAGVIDAAS